MLKQRRVNFINIIVQGSDGEEGGLSHNHKKKDDEVELKYKLEERERKGQLTARNSLKTSSTLGRTKRWISRSVPDFGRSFSAPSLWTILSFVWVYFFA